MGIPDVLQDEMLAGLKGETLPSTTYKKRYGNVPPTGGGGSHNYVTLSNGVGAIMHGSESLDVWHRTADSYDSYALFGNEAGSRNLYAGMNAISLMVAHDKLRTEKLRAHVRSFWTLLAVCSSDRLADYGNIMAGPVKPWKGLANVMVGARSWVKSKNADGTRTDFAHLEKSELDLMLVWLFDDVVLSNRWWGDCARTGLWHGLDFSEVEVLKSIVYNNGDVRQVVDWLPRFPQPTTIRRYDTGNFMACEKSWNSGSTSFCYSCFFNRNTRELRFLGHDNGGRTAPNTSPGTARINNGSVVATRKNPTVVSETLYMPPDSEIEWELS